MRSPTFWMASLKLKSAGALSTGFDSPMITSICTWPALISATSSRRAACCSDGTISGVGRYVDRRAKRAVDRMRDRVHRGRLRVTRDHHGAAAMRGEVLRHRVDKRLAALRRRAADAGHAGRRGHRARERLRSGST